MTAHDDLGRALSSWLAVDAQQPARAGDLERVLATTRAIHPRPGWLAGPGSHGINGPVTSARRAALTLAVIAAIALGVAAVVAGARLVTPPPEVDAKGLLAYALDGDIYVADQDGANPIAITEVSSPEGTCIDFWATGPMWSPDGRHLAYRGGRPSCDDGGAVVAEPNGHLVARIPGEGWLISWSPDSTRVAIWITNGQTIGIYGLDGARQAVLELPAGLGPPGDIDPVWSPNGASVLIRLSPPHPSVVWEFPVDGSDPRPVPDEDPRSRPGAVFTRDGTRVAYVPYTESQSLVMAAADGTELRTIRGAPNSSHGERGVGDYHGNPVWSQTGDRVAFTTTPSDPYNTSLPQPFELRVVDVSSGTVATIAAAQVIDPIGFSAAGDRVLFRRSDAVDGEYSLWSVNIDGSGLRLLVPGAGTGAYQWPSE